MGGGHGGGGGQGDRRIDVYEEHHVHLHDERHAGGPASGSSS